MRAPFFCRALRPPLELAFLPPPIYARLGWRRCCFSAENDDAPRAPATAAERGSQIGDEDRRATLDIDLLQFVVLPEAHPAGYRATKTVNRRLRFRQRFRSSRIRSRRSQSCSLPSFAFAPKTMRVPSGESAGSAGIRVEPSSNCAPSGGSNAAFTKRASGAVRCRYWKETLASATPKKAAAIAHGSFASPGLAGPAEFPPAAAWHHRYRATVSSDLSPSSAAANSWQTDVEAPISVVERISR